MPRRSAQKAESEIKREMEIRWAYLLRNPHFQQAVDELMDIRTEKTKDSEGRESAILLKYRLNNLSDDHLKVLMDSTLSWEKEKREKLLVTKPPLEDAVVALYWPDESDHMASGMGTGPYMTITVDLSYPIDLLLPLIDEEIRNAHPYMGRRRHREKDSFKLKAYDLARAGETFPEIARKLRSRVSTVKSAYWKAAQIIHETTQPPSKRESGKEIPFNPGDHIAGCAVCQKAKGEERFCPAARAWLAQDYRSQRDLPLDHEQLDAMRARKRERGRRTPRRPS